MLQSPHTQPTQSIMSTLKSKLIMSTNIGDAVRNDRRKKLMQNQKDRGLIFDINLGNASQKKRHNFQEVCHSINH